MPPRFDEVGVGTEIPARTFPLQRGSLVQYAMGSGDPNVIHWNERVAKAVGLPDVIAHGMLTMAEAGRLVSDWAGDPAAVVEFRVRFSRPVPVPDDDRGATLTVSGTVESTDDAARAVTVVLTATADTADGAKVLSAARAVVRLT